MDTADATTHSRPHRTHRLELLSHLPPGEARPTPLLFVHGAYSGAWCWEEHFLPYFARHGYAAHAVSLRGHGRSRGFNTLAFAGLDDYVEDVAQAVRRLEQPPVLIGHSMGGLVLQHYLERAEAPAAVMMASVPPQGLLMSAMSLAVRDWAVFHQLNLVQFLGGPVATLAAMRRALFSDDMPDAEVARHLERFQAESHRAILEMTLPQLCWGRRKVSAPVLVLAAERDAFFSHAMAEETAAAYGIRAVTVPGVAHVMMLEPRWQTAADCILAWLAERGL